MPNTISVQALITLERKWEFKIQCIRVSVFNPATTLDEFMKYLSSLYPDYKVGLVIVLDEPVTEHKFAEPSNQPG